MSMSTLTTTNSPSAAASVAMARASSSSTWEDARRRAPVRDTSMRPSSSSAFDHRSPPASTDDSALSPPSSPSSSWAHLPTAPRRATTVRRHRRLPADDEDIDQIYGARSRSSRLLRADSGGGSSSGPSPSATPPRRVSFEASSPLSSRPGSRAVSPTRAPPPHASPLHAAAEVGAEAGTRVRAFLSELGHSVLRGESSSSPRPQSYTSRAEELRSRYAPTASSSRSSPSSLTAGAAPRRRPASMASSFLSSASRGRTMDDPADERLRFRKPYSASASTSRRNSFAEEHVYESLYGLHYLPGPVGGSGTFPGVHMMSEEALMRTMNVAQMQLASAGNLALTLTRQLSEPLQPMFHVALVIGISVVTVLSLAMFMTIGYSLSVWDDVSHRVGSFAPASASSPSANLIRQRARKNVEASVQWGKRMLAGTFEKPFLSFSAPSRSASMHEPFHHSAAATTSSPSPSSPTRSSPDQPGKSYFDYPGAGPADPHATLPSMSRSTRTRRTRTGSMPSHVPWAALHAQSGPSPGPWSRSRPSSRAVSPTRQDERTGYDVNGDESINSPSGGPGLSSTSSSAFPPRPPLSVLIPSILLTLLIALGAMLLQMFIQRQNENAAKGGKKARATTKTSTAGRAGRASADRGSAAAMAAQADALPYRRSSMPGSKTQSGSRSSHEDGRPPASRLRTSVFPETWRADGNDSDVHGDARPGSRQRQAVPSQPRTAELQQQQTQQGLHRLGRVELIATGGKAAMPVSLVRRSAVIRAA